jgi:valine--pyruvate aminotransferase
MRFSRFGRQFSDDAGIVRLMDDLGQAVSEGRDMLMLGGGNPGYIPEMQRQFRERMRKLLDDVDGFGRLVGEYGPPQGDPAILDDLARLLRREYGWQVDRTNIALTNGSQSASFMLFNLFGGESCDGTAGQVLLPVTPEYIGYADQGLTDDLFVSVRPIIEHLDRRLFKYRIDFEQLHVTQRTAAICASRPTNPSGNVLTDEEVARLADIASMHDVPLILDGAYGPPFPDIVYARAHPYWDQGVVCCMSLSKLGLPGARTGIVIAREDVVKAIVGINAIINLTTASLGPALVRDMIADGEVLRLSREVVRPFYQRKAEAAVALLTSELAGCDYWIHRPEGAFFLWLWLRDLPVSSQVLYERLRARGVLVLSGHHFFPGLREPWRHREECLRINYAGDDARVARGLRIVADEVHKAYRDGP